MKFLDLSHSVQSAAKASVPLNLFVSFILIAKICIPCIGGVRISKSAYYDINIRITDEVPQERCHEILNSLENMMSDASATLFTALDGRFYFADFNVILPLSWNDDCATLNIRNGVSSKDSPNPPPTSMQGNEEATAFYEGSDVTISGTHAIFGDSIWTQQYGGCGVPGLQIHVSYKRLSMANSGKEFIKEWAKYRYGVFDEIGYRNDSIYPRCYSDNGDNGIEMHVTSCSDTKMPTIDEAICSNTPIITHNNNDNNDDRDDDDYELSLLNVTGRTSLMFAPHAPNVRLFCDAGNHNRYAPTKHNTMCDRRSTMDVILENADFNTNRNSRPSTVGDNLDVGVNTKPTMTTRRPHTEIHYVIVIDDTAEVARRESWSFLRNAFRKWVVYDLMANSAVGVIMASGENVDRSLGITALSNATNRDLVASFLPYTPSDSSLTPCIGCAVDKAMRLFANAANDGKSENVIVIIAPGMPSTTNETKIKYKLEAAHIRLATITYPDQLAFRRPLDALTSAIDGHHHHHHRSSLSFTVNEKKYNSEKSFLTSYVELVTVLMKISEYFDEIVATYPNAQAAMEIHRNEIHDDGNSYGASGFQNNIRQVNGKFYIEPYVGLPAGFYIYTHSIESPLIQAVRLISPSGEVYSTRSDQRLPVKQISIVAPLNETGTWLYEIDRYVGNPQPHVVQVEATAVAGKRGLVVKANAWVTRSGSGPNTFFTLYCEVRRGRYPIRDAVVRASMAYHDKVNNVASREEYDLWDSGNGASDIMAGDGIYSRHVRIRASGSYTFHFYVFGRDGVTTTIKPQPAAGRQSAAIVKTGPFERYGSVITFHVDPFADNDDDHDDDNPHPGETSPFVVGHRILDLKGALTDDHFNFSWTPSDLSNATMYEVRYAASRNSIVDNFVDAMILGVHNDESLGSHKVMSYAHEISQHSEFHGKTWFFAMRPLNDASGDGGGSASNVVEIKVPPKIVDLPPLWTLPGGNVDGDGSDDSMTPPPSIGDSQIDGNDSQSSQAGVPWLYIVPFIIIAVIIIILIAICALGRMNRCRHRNLTKVKREKIISIADAHQQGTLPLAAEKHNAHINETIDGNVGGGMDDGAGNPNGLPTPSSYNFIDHHTVGIPIYEEDGMSMGKDLSNYDAPMYLSDEPPPPELYADHVGRLSHSYGGGGGNIGISIISTESWSSAYPRDHNCSSAAAQIYDRRPNSNGTLCAVSDPPAVPPLPASSLLNIMHEPQSYHNHEYHQQQNAMGTQLANGDYSGTHTQLPPPTSQMPPFAGGFSYTPTNHDVNSFHDPNDGGYICVEKRRRNVTMV